jgi:K+/H+ antiporter YhaU regulatory subunit KhtT
MPGVGVKYAFRTADGARVSVILHNDGQREIYYYAPGEDGEPAAVIELVDRDPAAKGLDSGPKPEAATEAEEQPAAA